jgi:hypothetical protein
LPTGILHPAGQKLFNTKIECGLKIKQPNHNTDIGSRSSIGIAKRRLDLPADSFPIKFGTEPDQGMVHVDHLDKRNTEQIRRGIRAFWSHILPAFRKVSGESLRILPHPKPTFDLKIKVFEGFCRDDYIVALALWLPSRDIKPEAMPGIPGRN